MSQLLTSERLMTQVVRRMIPPRLTMAPGVMMPSCWAMDQTPGPAFLTRCATPVPTHRDVALAQGWVFIVADLRPVRTRPATMGDVLWVPLCPEHADDDTLWGTRLTVSGSQDMQWGEAAWAQWGQPHVISATDCPVCPEPRVQHRPGNPPPAGYQAAFTPMPTQDMTGRMYRGVVGIACPDHAYVLWDYTAGV